MGRLPSTVRARIIILWKSGCKQRDICDRLKAEGRGIYSQTAIGKLIRKYKETGGIADRSGKGRKQKMPIEHRDIINEAMVANNETTSNDLQNILREKTGVEYSVRTIIRIRKRLGWIRKKARYCQLIRVENCINRLEYCMKCLDADEQFTDMIFTDECTIEMESAVKFRFRRVGDFSKDLKGAEFGLAHNGQMLVPRPKHAAKLHVWAGISCQGATPILIFDGIMRKEFYIEEILSNTLKDFLQLRFPDGQHRFFQDNDPKHTSRAAQDFMDENGINWCRTPAESPDLNPIEKLWHELKHYLRKKVKPKTIDELKDGICEFWETRVDVEKCRKYIGNLRKVVPEVIRREGRATGY